MKKRIATFLFLVSVFAGFGQKKHFNNYEKAKAAITRMMEQQARDWSSGNIEAFMEGYWKSDLLKFIGRRGITYGWQQTLENYKKAYPTKAEIGELRFELLDFDQLAKDVFMVTGRFYLKREIGDASGIFTLILRRFGKKWKIIVDHTS